MKKNLLFLLLLVIGINLVAIPAAPYLIQFDQEDGTSIDIYGRGDEQLHWWETTDGYSLLSKNNTKVYAIYDEDGDLIPSNVVAHNLEMRDNNEIAFTNSIRKGLTYSENQVRLVNTLRNQRMGGFPTTGTANLIVILANFNDTSTQYTQANFNNLMNQDGYSTHGSFKQYYLENSYGQLTINTTVTDWVTVPNSHNYYGPESKWPEFIRDACVAADDVVDFSQFDNNNNGDVDGVAVYHQGMGQEITGNTNDIWSHNYSIVYGGFELFCDGKQIKSYTCQPERGWYSMTGIGTICHEFGHNLGAPDFYDTDYQTGGQHDGNGDWDVMSSGSYNGNGSCPAHHNIWTKELYGWLDITELTSTTNDLILHDSTTNPEAYYFTTATDGERYILQNVQQTGFNSELPGSGMLIYHADEPFIAQHMNANNINATSHQGMYIIKAGYSLNSSGGCWPSGSHTSFTDNTSPGINPWEDHQTDKGLENITKTGADVTFDYFSNGYYVPTIVFSGIYNNQNFNLGEDFSIDFEMFSTIMTVDYVELFLDETSLQMFFNAPYHYDFTNVEAGEHDIIVKSYVGSTAYTATLKVNVIDTEIVKLIENFESFTNFTTEFPENMEITGNTESNTVSIPGVTYDNATTPKAFMVFNPKATVPALDLEMYSGDKALARFTPIIEEGQTAVPDKFVITADDLGSIEATTAVIEFNVLGTDEDNETFSVGTRYLNADESVNDTPIHENLEATDTWTHYSLNVTEAVNENRCNQFWFECASTEGNAVFFDDIKFTVLHDVDNEDNNAEMVNSALINNYPNPFNPETTIKYSVKGNNSNSNVALDIYNIKGQHVKTLINKKQSAGIHTVVWNGTDKYNNNVASGVYFYKLKIEEFSSTKKMVLLK